MGNYTHFLIFNLQWIYVLTCDFKKTNFDITIGKDCVKSNYKVLLVG